MPRRQLFSRGVGLRLQTVVEAAPLIAVGDECCAKGGTDGQAGMVREEPSLLQVPIRSADLDVVIERRDGEPSGDTAGVLALILEAACEALDCAVIVSPEETDAPTAGPELRAPIVASGRSYGELRAQLRTRSSTPEQAKTLERYAGMVAAALDAQARMDGAQREADATQVLLDLSIALGEVTSLEEVASRVAHAAPSLVDCDGVVVVAVDRAADTARIIGAHGSADADMNLLNAIALPLPSLANDRDITFFDASTEDGLVRSLMPGVPEAAALVVPIVTDGEVAGFLAVVVAREPERLSTASHDPKALIALAAQLANAIRNNRLLEQVHHQAMHDVLTNLPNRTLILDRVDQMLARARRNGTSPAVLFIDLDGFKDINDTLGHDVGDQVLRAVGDRFSSSLRDADTIGRLGGDEFVVLVEGTPSSADATFVAQRLLDALGTPLVLPGRERLPLAINASIGIATGLRSSAAELLRDADVALYRAKARGKGRYIVFEPAMHIAVRDRLGLDVDLHRAFERGEFFLAYQPVFDLREQRLSGAEALLRWKHPRRGLVAPGTFVPLLEESRLINEVGRWSLEEACTTAVLWHQSGHLIDIAVNVSARQFEDADFAAEVADILARARLEPRSLVLEVTENTLMRDPDMSEERITQLKRLGIQIAVDDFGTGYSSLVHMRRFAVDILKIDRSFIAAMGQSSEGEELIRAIVQFAKTLGVTTVAEGIENQMQFARLRREKFDRGQGYLLARPLDASSFKSLLTATASTRPAISSS